MKVTQFNTNTQCLILVTSLFFYAVCGPLPWARDAKQLALYVARHCATSITQ